MTRIMDLGSTILLCGGSAMYNGLLVLVVLNKVTKAGFVNDLVFAVLG